MWRAKAGRRGPTRKNGPLRQHFDTARTRALQEIVEEPRTGRPPPCRAAGKRGAAFIIFMRQLMPPRRAWQCAPVSGSQGSILARLQEQKILHANNYDQQQRGRNLYHLVGGQGRGGKKGRERVTETYCRNFSRGRMLTRRGRQKCEI